MVIIVAAANGWIIRAEDGSELVYEEPDTDTGAVECFAQMLRSVVDLLGMTGSRHDAARIHVVVEPGDKYMGEAHT